VYGMGMDAGFYIWSFLCLVVVVGAVLHLKKSGASGGAVGQADEMRILAEIHAGLGRLERRVESLEDILLEPGKGKDSHE
jgi:hypothetical protein